MRPRVAQKVMKDVTPLLTQIPPQTNIPTADQVQELTQLVADFATDCRSGPEHSRYTADGHEL